MVMVLLLFSGSASRLSRKSSYHHCTLLHSSDRSTLTTVLRPSCPGIHSNATPSVPSPVTNLVDHAPMLQWEELLDALGDRYNTGSGFWSCKNLVQTKSGIQSPVWNNQMFYWQNMFSYSKTASSSTSLKPPESVKYSWF